MSHPVLPGVIADVGAIHGRRPLASIDEITLYLGVTKQTVYQWSSRGGGPRLIKVGRHLKARWADIEIWLDAQTVNPA